MSVQCDGLLRLVEELPEEEVQAVPDDVRPHVHNVRNRPWPPAWFGAGEGRTDDGAARAEDLLETAEPTFSAAELPGLCDVVASLDPDLQRIVDEYGYPEFWHRPNTFESFVWFILEQQVSLASARAALEKLRDRVGAITPANVLELTDDELRAVYFSRQKITYVRGLARKIENGDLDLAVLGTLTDGAVRECLITLKGIGNWTVDVYLILVLHRLDLFPAGDLAAVNGLKELKGLPRTTPFEELVKAAQQWAPYRTIGTMLLWHHYLSRRSPRRRA